MPGTSHHPLLLLQTETSHVNRANEKQICLMSATSGETEAFWAYLKWFYLEATTTAVRLVVVSKQLGFGKDKC